MLDIDKVRDWLLENRIDKDGHLDLRGLDFSEFEGDVYISEMIVKGNLCQNDQYVYGNIYQSYSEAEGILEQRYCSGSEGVDQRGTRTLKDLLTGNSYVRGNLLYEEDNIDGVVAKIENKDKINEKIKMYMETYTVE